MRNGSFKLAFPKLAAPKGMRRQHAIDLGFVYYWYPTPCIHGHEAGYRNVKNGTCHQCNLVRRPKHLGRSAGLVSSPG